MSEEQFEPLTPGERAANELPSPELRAFEARLASLAPRPAAIDRDRLMFEAGRASQRVAPLRVRWAWPTAFSAMSALAASLFLALVLRPPMVVDRLVRAPAAVEVAEIDRSDDGARERARADDSAAGRQDDDVVRPTAPRSPEPSYLELRDRVLAMGIDTWQAPRDPRSVAERHEATYHDLMIEWGQLQ